MENIFIKSPRHILKPIFIGDDYVGKTTLITKYTNSDYQNKTSTDFFSKELFIDNQNIKLIIWDVKGHKSFEKITNNYIRDSNAYIIIFDLTNLNSFYNINEWIKKIKTNNILFNDYYPILLLGNKKDLVSKRKVSYEEVKKFAIFNKLLYAEISVDDDINTLNLLLKMYFIKILSLNNNSNEVFNYTSIFKISNDNQNVSNKLNEFEFEFIDDIQYKSKCCYDCKKQLHECIIL